MNETPLKIAVLGPRQSGKTCLAAGLSAVNTPGFTVGATDDSRKLLSGIKVALQGKAWPAGNNMDDTNEINLMFQKAGKPPIPVTFLDFAGERLQTPEAFKEFANKHLVGLSGAVVLVNPGSDAFLEGNARARQVALDCYDRLFAWFRDSGQKPFFVALTITASDRLEADGDLAGRRDAVEDFVGQLENTLGTIQGVECRRFSVTITGHLENQAEPQLAKKRDNTSAKPFLWLLDELKWAPIRAGIWRKVRLAAWMALGLAGVWSIWAAVEKSGTEREIGTIAGEVSDAITSDKATEAKKKFRELEGMTNGFGKALAEQKLHELEPKVWALCKKTIERDIRDIKTKPGSNASTERVGMVDNGFNSFVPQFDVSSVEDYKRLQREWNDEKPGLQGQFDVQQLLDKVSGPLDKLAVKHGADVPDKLFDLYRELEKVMLPETAAPDLAKTKRGLEARLDERTKEEFQWLVDDTFSDGLPSDKADREVLWLQGLMAVWQPVTEEGKSAKEQITKSIQEKSGFSTGKWDEDQRDICVNWWNAEVELRGNRPLAGQGGVWSAYQTFARTNASNPYFASMVQKRVYTRAEAVLESTVEWFSENGGGTTNLWRDKVNFTHHWSEVNKQFDSFRQLCREIKEDKTPLHASWAWQFATLCMDGKKVDRFDNAFPQTLVITQVVASVDYFGDIPWWYEFTAFGASLNVESFNLNGSPKDAKSFAILPFDKSGVDAKRDAGNSVMANKKKQEGAKEKKLVSHEVSVPVHAFEHVSMVMVATDWNSAGGARHSLTPPSTKILTWGKGWTAFGADGKRYDLSFNIDRNTVSEKPKALFLTFYGRVEGESMADCLRLAKEKAQKAVAGK